MADQQAFGQICERVCAEEGWELLPSGIRVTWPNGRRQLVVLEFFEFANEELVRLSTTIGQAIALSKDRLLSALRVNAGLAHGALAVVDGDLVMTDTLMLRDADPGEIRASIAYLSRTADEYEKIIFRTDRH